MTEIGHAADNAAVKNSPPADYGNIGRCLAAAEDADFEQAWEVHDRQISPNGMNFREMFTFLEDADVREHMIGVEYSRLVRDEKLSPGRAMRILLHAARNLMPPEKVRRAVHRGILLEKAPDSRKRFDAGAEGAKHRASLEQTLRNPYRGVPVAFGIDGLDALVPGGMTAGEVLHIAGGEGGLKTALLLHILCHYLDRGGRALLFSLDMAPETIELRRLMRLMDCGKERVTEQIRHDTAEYRKIRTIPEEQDKRFSVMGGPQCLRSMHEAILMSGADVIAVDYVSLVGRYGSEAETAREVTRAVRWWSRTWGVAFILLSQMSRESLRDLIRGGTGGHGIGGSSLEQLADYELELKREESRREGGGHFVARLRKNRAGQSGVSFEIFPRFPSLVFSGHAERIERNEGRRPLFSDCRIGGAS